MKKIFRALLVLLVIIVVVIGAAAAFVSFRSLPNYPVEKVDVKIDYTPMRVEHGAKLASMLCKNCHYSDDTRRFTGRQITEAPQFGEIWAPNITKHPDAGIGKWTDGELVYFLRTGVKPDGTYIPPYMPKLAHISDEDMNSIISFLRSDLSWVEPDATKQPKSKPSFFTKFLCTIGAVEPFPYPKQPIAGPDTANMVEYGRYIALNQLECFSCHSQDFAKNDYFTPEKSPGFFGGGNKLFDTKGHEIHSMNITMDPNTGIGNWTEEQFVKAVKYGTLPDGSEALRYPMLPYANLSDKEAKAIYAYLKTVPQIKNKVERKMYP